MKDPLVAILGAGPAGLIAAHTCATKGVPFSIFSKKLKSNLGGAQFGHIEIPGLVGDLEDHPPDAIITYQVRGDAETYQRKVYGGNPVPFVSFENVADGLQVPAWNLRRLYDQLWDMYSTAIVDLEITPEMITKLPTTFDYVFSSIPAKSICLGRIDPIISHLFADQPVRIYNEALAPIPDNTILYDGTEEHSYSRMSRLFGVGSTEWGGSSPVPPLDSIRTINKPISTNCDCHQADLGGGIPSVIRIGRFGTWRKGVLSHHSFNRVTDVLASAGVE